MNRDIIEPGKTFDKMGESLVLFGSFGAILYPLFFYYAAYVSILKRNEQLLCSLVAEATAKATNETVTDYVR